MKYLLFSVLCFTLYACMEVAPVTEGTEEKSDSTLTEHHGTADPDNLKGKIRSLPDYDTTEWVELNRLDASIIIEMRYATDSNFVGEQLYGCSRCFLRPEVAFSVAAAHRELQQEGLRLKMLDCYRPLPVQWKLWEKKPDPRFVTDPRKGSMHNRGAAIDLTVVGPDGKALEMGTPYDFFGREAYHTYTDLPAQVLENRKRLKEVMETHGFLSIRTEWWHYSFTRKNYPLSEMQWNCPNENAVSPR